MKRFRVEFHEDDRYRQALAIEAETMLDALTVALASPKCPASINEISTGQHVQTAQRVKIAAAEDIFPRLAIAEEMAGVLEAFRDTDCERMGCMQCRDDNCLSKLWGRLNDVLAKYHGEVESND
jgi:hypothetical protein